MANIEDVAAYVLNQRGPITAMKLQKLCYYAQAWHLVWEDQPLFDGRIEAWANGPVITELYRMHRGKFNLDSGDINGDPSQLTEAERESIDAVLEFYGDMTAHHLSELTHREDPWLLAREEAGLAPMERGTAEITTAAMHEFYLDLATAGRSVLE
ncbi:MAG TPA: type II toxin-antitoxin system antitoxin SocA domain-containing protein [Micromonosporaceae bacterium]|nr:type II toxin-antitoxin system antitoxin SocA domain-containing protein [Micromonosporaceae bacterium]